MDGFTSSDTYPYSSHYSLEGDSINYMRNSVKAVSRRLRRDTTFYVFDSEDPILAAYRGIFPGLFKDASAMPAGCASTSATPKCCSVCRRKSYGLYHMTNPEVFYNREDLWTVATETGMTEGGEQTTAAHGA
jgi:uncharacterized protein